MTFHRMTVLFLVCLLTLAFSACTDSEKDADGDAPEDGDNAEDGDLNEDGDDITPCTTFDAHACASQLRSSAACRYRVGVPVDPVGQCAYPRQFMHCLEHGTCSVESEPVCAYDPKGRCWCDRCLPEDWERAAEGDPCNAEAVAEIPYRRQCGPDPCAQFTTRESCEMGDGELHCAPTGGMRVDTQRNCRYGQFLCWTVFVLPDGGPDDNSRAVDPDGGCWELDDYYEDREGIGAGFEICDQGTRKDFCADCEEILSEMWELPWCEE